MRIILSIRSGLLLVVVLFMGGQAFGQQLASTRLSNLSPSDRAPKENKQPHKPPGTTHRAILEQTITGTVTDGESGDALPGVNILAKGTSTGTVTDVEGKYRLTVSDEVATLVFSSIGYLTQEVAINGRSAIDLGLAPDVQSLDEVVVVGYGTQEKSKLVGSVSQISSQVVNDRAVPQLRQALTGQMPGVTVIQRSGQPGNQGGSIQIRGVSSINSSSAPLILVDGIPTESFNDIDPNVVENISVLKDASSAAIYGARAANGVVLVTTKTAKSDELQVSYNGYAGIQVPTEFPEYVNSWEYAELLNEANTNDDLPPAYLAEEIELFKNGSDPDNYPNSDFINSVLKKSSAQTGHNITLSNGIGASNYLLSLGYLYQNGIIEENNHNRYNLRLNVVSESVRKLSLPHAWPECKCTTSSLPGLHPWAMPIACWASSAKQCGIRLFIPSGFLTVIGGVVLNRAAPRLPFWLASPSTNRRAQICF